MHRLWKRYQSLNKWIQVVLWVKEVLALPIN
jgi:hypothetical protein